MTDQDARDLIARLRAASKRIAIMARDEGIKDPSEKRAITWEAADALDRLLRERASLRAQIIEECARVPIQLREEVERRAKERPDLVGAGGFVLPAVFDACDTIASAISALKLSPPSPSTIEGEEGR